jgi:hypothetical protein
MALTGMTDEGDAILYVVQRVGFVLLCSRRMPEDGTTVW